MKDISDLVLQVASLLLSYTSLSQLLSSMRLYLAIFAAFAAYVAAAPSTHYVIHEKRDAPMKRWVKREALQPRGLLPMRIGLTQSNLDEGHAMLMEV